VICTGNQGCWPSSFTASTKVSKQGPNPMLARTQTAGAAGARVWPALRPSDRAAMQAGGDAAEGLRQRALRLMAKKRTT